MKKFSVTVYLVNTGWVGSSAKSGAKRFSLPKTRLILDAILNGEIENASFDKDKYFGFQMPLTLTGIEPSLLNPLKAWDDLEEYHESARELVKKFQINYEQYDLGDEVIRNAGPKYFE